MSPANFQDKLKEIIRKLPPQSVAREAERLKTIIDKGGNSVEGMRAIAVDEDVEVDLRAFACWILGRLDEPENSVTLLRLLDSEQTAIRVTAIQSLSNFQNEAVIQALGKSINDIDDEVRKVSAQSLGWMSNETAVSILIEQLQNNNEKNDVRGVIAEALGNTNNTRAITPLIQVLSDTSAEVRFWAVHALGQLCDIRAIPELQKLVSDESQIPGYGSVGQEAESSIRNIQARQSE